MSHADQSAEKLKLSAYLYGFLGSLYLTLTAYFLVRHQLVSRRWLIALVSGLAIAQFILQAIFFLHLSIERRPRWKLLVFIFMIGVVAIVVFGSLWIMTNLNYHMTQHQINNYLRDQDGL